MSATQNQYDIGLNKTGANYVPLTPLSFIARSAAVFPNHVSAVYQGKSFTWAETFARIDERMRAAMLSNLPPRDSSLGRRGERLLRSRSEAAKKR